MYIRVFRTNFKVFALRTWAICNPSEKGLVLHIAYWIIIVQKLPIETRKVRAKRKEVAHAA